MHHNVHYHRCILVCILSSHIHPHRCILSTTCISTYILQVHINVHPHRSDAS
ncbi:unnamed protein product [Ixodes pacificus]